jgi:hypothetical protein
MKEYLNQVSSIENLEENGEFYDELVKNIKVGRADRVVSEMVMIAHSDRDTMSYNDLLDSARSLNERIVYDNGLYVLTASNDIITLYEYVGAEDMLGDELEIGDKVLWADPDDDARDLNRVWEVYAIQSEELVKISTGKLGEKGYSEAEVPPSELVKRSSIIHVEVID